MTTVAELHRAMFEAVERRDWQGLESLLHDEYAYTAGDGVEQGPDAALALAKTYTDAFPDLAFEIRHQHVLNNISIIECQATGTHQGELEGVAPTGRRIELCTCNIIEERDGKILNEREYYDSGLLMSQLGALDGMHATDDHQATVAGIYEAFGRGDIEFILDRLADDVAWDVDRPHWGLPWYEARTGRESVREFFSVLDEQLQFDAFEVVAVLASDDKTAAIIRFDLTMKATGKRVADTEIHLWSFDDDGKVAAFDHVVDQHGQLLAFEQPAEA